MRIALLLSGGVDSAVALHLLHSQGHELHPFYIRIGRDDGSDGCSADEDIELCNLLCARYGMTLEIVDLHEQYWQDVMGYSLSAVKAGLTPHPDMMCNKLIKFGAFERLRGHDFDKVATGHYARIIRDEGRYWLGTAVDPVKDQTDFLAQISYAQLSHLLFPLGDLPKAEARRLALELKLPNATRKDSQGICFLGKIDYDEFLARQLGERPGPIIDLATGRTLGQHRGYWFHTIGQRKGLGLGGGPWFVVRKDVDANTLYVSHGYDTPLQYGRCMRLGDMHWITGDPFEDSAQARSVKFKVRHNPHFMDGKLEKTDFPGEYVLTGTEPVQGIAPGQFGIIYSHDARICLGSGTIISQEQI